MKLFDNIFNQFTGQAQSQVPSFATPQTPRTMNYTQPIVTPAKRNTTGYAPGFEGTVDESKSLFNRLMTPVETGVKALSQNIQQGGQQLSDIAMKQSENAIDRGYNQGYINLGKKIKEKHPQYSDMSDEELGRKIVAKYPQYQDIVDEGSGIMSNPISGSAASIESGLAKGLGTMFSGISALGSAPLQETGTAGITRFAKGALETGLGSAQLATSVMPTTMGAKALLAPTVNTLFSTDTAGKVISPITEGIGTGIGMGQESLGFNPNSSVSKDIQNIGSTAGTIALLGGAQKGASKAYDISKPVINSTGKAIVRGAEYVAPKVVQGVKSITPSLPKGSDISTRANRFIAGDEQKFKDQMKETPGEFATSRGMKEVGEKAIEKAQQNFERSKAEADTSFDAIQGKFSTKGSNNDIVGDLLKANKEKMDAQPRNKDATRVNELYRKYETNEGLTMSEVNEAKRIHARNHQYSYEQRTSNEARNSSDIQNDIREWQFQTAKENGFLNADKVNMETKGWKMFADSLAKKMDRSGANNSIGITDWIALSGGNPTNVALFLGKKVASSNLIKTGAIKLFSKQTKPSIIEGTKADIQRANIEKNVNRGISGDRSDIGGKSMVGRIAGLLEAPKGKPLSAKVVNVKPMTDSPKAESGKTFIRPGSSKKVEGQKLLTSGQGKPLSANVVNVKPIILPKKLPTSKIVDPRVTARNDYLELKSLEESLTKGDEAMKSKAREVFARKLEQVKVNMDNALYQKVMSRESRKMMNEYSDTIYPQGMQTVFNRLKGYTRNKGNYNDIEGESGSSVLKKQFSDYVTEYNDRTGSDYTVNEMWDIFDDRYRKTPIKEVKKPIKKTNSKT